MSRQAQQVCRQLSHIERHFTGGLDGIEVNRHTVSRSDFADATHIKQHTGLVVGMHDRDQGGVLSDPILEFVAVQPALVIHTDPVDPAPFPDKLSGEPMDGAVLDGGRYHVPPGRFGRQHAADGQVDALGAATRKDYFSWLGVNQFRDLFSGALDSVPYFLAEPMNARWVGVLSPHVRQHGLRDACQRPCGRVIVKIDVVAHRWIVRTHAEPCTRHRLRPIRSVVP